MTRFLRSALGAPEPTFSQGIRQLEQAAGAPSHDIRLTSDVVRQVKVKIAELGLDPEDTTGPELYEVLRQRLQHDESLVRFRLGISVDAPSAQVIARVSQFLSKSEVQKNCFTIKTSVVKKMLKSKPPKVAMKRLGYRSVDSMLKHEPPAQLFVAGQLYESAAWQRGFFGQYQKLRPSDFESRHMQILHPKSEKWQQVARDFAAANRRNIVGFRELGVVLVLPLEKNLDGLAITTLLLAIEELNTIRAYSSFVKLQQVKPTFGQIVQQAAKGHLLTGAAIAGHAVPWQMVQRYYAKFSDAYRSELFEPHVQPEDLSWQSGEETLAQLEPTLRFWQGTEMLALLHENEPVSLNILDVALSHTNHLGFGNRVAHYFRTNLWHELMTRYLHQQNLEEAVSAQLSNELLEQNTDQEAIA